MGNTIIRRALIIGLVSSFLGTIAMGALFMGMIFAAEHWSGMHFPNDTLAGIWNSSPGFILFWIVGVWAGWFGFAFFITYSRLSSRRDAKARAAGR